MDCLGFADDKAVFYEAKVNMCTLPALVTLQVSQPDIGFLFAETLYSDINPPRKIGNFFILTIKIMMVFLAMLPRKTGRSTEPLPGYF